MRTILDLNSLIDFRNTSILGSNQDKTDELFELIRSGRINSAEEGQQYFYPDTKGAAGNFNRLKKGLRKRLINTLFTTEVGKTEYLKRYFQVNKKNVASDLLIKRGKSATGATIAQEALKMAIKYQFVDLVVSLSRKLAHHFAVAVPDRKQYQKYRCILQEYTEYAFWENKARDHYHDLAMELRLGKTIKSDLICKAERYKAELSTIGERINTMEFQLFRYNIDLFLYKMLNQREGIVDTCRKGIAFIEKLPFTPTPLAQRTFHFNIIPAYLQSGNYESTWQTIQQLKSLVEKGSHNWIGIHQYQAILGFYWRRLDISREAVEMIYKSKFHRLIKEELKIYEFYLALLEGETRLKLGKFLNETPHFSMDKKGMNINILSLQVLIFLRRNDRGAIIDRMEAIRTYAYRYLTKDPSTRRSMLFFRMLYLLGLSAFDPSEVEKRSPGITKALQETPRYISAIDIEVVPYEVLWEKVTEWC